MLDIANTLIITPSSIIVDNPFNLHPQLLLIEALQNDHETDRNPTLI